jgi:Flp pilus assembly protein TadB
METKRSNNGIGLGGVLFVVFLVLKLTHVIDWSWWWITAPLWVLVVITLLVLVIQVWIVVRSARKTQSRLKQRFDQFNAEREKIISEQKEHQ